MACNIFTASKGSFLYANRIIKTDDSGVMCACNERIYRGTFTVRQIRRNPMTSKREKDSGDQVNSAWRRYLHDINII